MDSKGKKAQLPMGIEPTTLCSGRALYRCATATVHQFKSSFQLSLKDTLSENDYIPNFMSHFQSLKWSPFQSLGWVWLELFSSPNNKFDSFELD